MSAPDRNDAAPAGPRTGLRADVLGTMVHALTASGAVLAFLAVLATERGDWRGALLWLIAAMVVDGADGPLARRLDIVTTVPRISGATLDLVVDFLTYVFVPVLLLRQESLVAPSLVVPAAAAILLSSLYHFSRRDAKSADAYFVGFPAVWNVVVFYLLVARPGQTAGAIVVGLFSALTVAPVLFVHPVRVKAFQPALGIVTLVWAASSLALLWPSWTGPARSLLLAVSVGAVTALLAFGLIRTVRGPRDGGG